MSIQEILATNVVEDRVVNTLPGIRAPNISAPPFGVTRGGPIAPGGYMRNASSTQASIYGNLAAELRLISSSLLNVERTSSLSLW